MSVVTIRFDDGIRQDDDPRSMKMSALRQARNVVIEADNSIEARPGNDAVPITIANTANSLSTIKRVFGYSGETCIIDGDVVYSREPGNSTLAPVDEVPQCGVFREDVVEHAASFDNGYDIAISSSYILYAYIPSYATKKVYVTLVNRTTGAKVLGDVLVSSGGFTPTDVRCLIVGNYGIVLYGDNASPSQVYGVRADLTAPFAGFSAQTQVTTGGGFNERYWDACEISGDSTAFFIAVCTTSTPAPFSFKIYRVTASSWAASSSTFSHNSAAFTNVLGIACTATSGEQAWVSWGVLDSGNVCTVYCASFDPSSLAAGLAPTSTTVAFSGYSTLGRVKIGICRKDATTIGGVVGMANDVIAPYLVEWWNINTSGTVNAGWVLRDHKLISRPQTINSRMYFVIQGMNLQTLQGATNIGFYDTGYSLIDAEWTRNAAADTPGRLVARSAMRQTAPTVNQRMCINLYQTPSTSYYSTLGALRKSGVIPGGGTTRTGIGRIEFDFHQYTNWPSDDIGNLKVVGGGCPGTYDGTRLVEFGFDYQPSAPSITQTAAVGGIANGNYRYALIWEWFDSKGNVHRSPPTYSSTVNVTTGPSSRLTINTNGLCLTWRNDPTTYQQALTPPALIPYRTLELGANPTSAYYRVFLDVPTSACLVQTSGAPLSYQDSAPDATLSAYPLLYTTGGAVEAQSPGAVAHVLTHRGRVWMVLEDRLTLGYTTEFTSGEAPRYNDSFTYSLPDAGRITGLGSLDDKLIVFKDGAIFAITGDGPNDAGAGADFSRPYKIMTDVGCDNWRSIVSTDKGLFFANARRGIFLLTRGLEVQWIGHRVETLFDTYPIVTSAVLHNTRRWVIFTCRGSETSSTGVSLVYDLEHDRWTSWDYGAGALTPVVGACLANGVYTVALTTPSVLRTNISTWKDGTANVVKLVEMGWLQDGVATDMLVRRAQFLGANLAEHSLTVDFARDFSSSYDSPSFSVSEANIATMDLERLRFGPKYQRCQSFSMKITINPSANGTGRGTRLHGVAFDVFPLSGMYPRISPSAQQG